MLISRNTDIQSGIECIFIMNDIQKTGESNIKTSLERGTDQIYIFNQNHFKEIGQEISYNEISIFNNKSLSILLGFKMKNAYFLRILFVLLVFFVAYTSNGAIIDYYVSTGGNNRNNGRSETTPYRTIAYALTKCTTATDDYVIHLMPNSQWGAFRENIRIRKTSSIKFNSLTLTGPDIEFDSDGLLELETARIGGVESSTSYGNPVISVEASNVEIKNLRVYHPSRINTTSTGSNLISIAAGCSDIHIYRCFIGPQARENAIYNSQGDKINGMNVNWEFDVDDGDDTPDFYPGGRNGIFIDGTDRNTYNITIEECVIYYITGEGEGIMMYAPKTSTYTNSSISNVYVLNNMIIMNRRSGIVAAGEISNAVFEGNSIYHNGWYPLDFDVANTSTREASEYGNGIVLMKCFDQTEDNSERVSIDLTGNSIFDNYNSGVYVFGGTSYLNISYYSDIWGNKDGLVFNGDPTDPAHPYDQSVGSEDYNFSNISISDLLIHSNQRFGIYYNTNDNTNPIVAEDTYFEEPSADYGWGGPDESLGPKMAWGDFDKEADTYYEQNAERDGGRDYINEDSYYYDPSDPNNYMTLPSIVYGPVDANPYRKSLIYQSKNNFVVNSDQSDSYFDNMNNVTNCTPAGSAEEIIYVLPSSTPYTNNNISFSRPVTILGVNDENGNKPIFKYTTDNDNYIPALVSTGTSNVILENIKLVCRDQNGDLLGKISSSEATGNITLKKCDFYKENVSMNNYSWTQLSNYFEDNVDHNDGRGLFVKADLIPADTTGCVLWLKGNSITDKSDGDLISQWDDNSSYGNNAMQSSNNYKPRYTSNVTNYQPGIYSNSNETKFLTLDPVNYSLEQNSSKSVFIVFKTPSSLPTVNQFIFEVGNLNCGYSVGIMMVSGNPKLIFTLWRYNNSTTTFLEDASNIEANTVYFARFWYNENSSGTNFRAYLNDAQVGDGRNFTGFVFSSSTDYGNSVIGAAENARMKGWSRTGTGNPFIGQIAEIIVYNNYDVDQWNATVDYFTDKYGFSDGWPRTSKNDGVPGSENQFYEGEEESISVYPNPFVQLTNLKVGVPETQNVKIELFDALGRNISTMFDGTMNGKSMYEFSISASELQSGIYFVRVSGNTFVRTEKVILSK